jgi:hypothetical protein
MVSENGVNYGFQKIYNLFYQKAALGATFTRRAALSSSTALTAGLSKGSHLFGLK